MEQQFIPIFSYHCFKTQQNKINKKLRSVACFLRICFSHFTFFLFFIWTNEQPTSCWLWMKNDKGLKGSWLLSCFLARFACQSVNEREKRERVKFLPFFFIIQLRKRKGVNLKPKKKSCWFISFSLCFLLAPFFLQTSTFFHVQNHC